MRILITGAAGMLGTDACRILAAAGHEIQATDRRAQENSNSIPLDITNLENVQDVFRRFQPELILHCAAMTNVDGCERDPDAAFRTNALGTWTVASAAENVGAALAVVSTDFVFDGALRRPYTEFDAPNPICHYGASKLAGENLARANCRKTYVIRTSWLYGIHGRNFPFAMISQARTKPELSVVADQIGAPTYTVDLVETISQIIQTPLYGTYHVSNAGETSWKLFADAILQKSGLSHIRVNPLTSEEFADRFGSPTNRPKYSVLRHYALELQNKDNLRPWEDALDAFLLSAREHGKL